MRSLPRLLLAVVAATAASTAGAQEPIRFARTPDISPDGRQVAFSYLGDIWVVEAIGGVARPVTMHEAHDINPVFSPDGKYIAFSSNRHGSYDVFVVPAVGGKPRRLTFDSAADLVTGWTPDGKHVVFSSNRSTAFPPNLDSYTVPVDGGPERKLPLFEAKEAHFAPGGNYLAYVRGPGDRYRRGYRGSSNDDIWIAAADGSFQRQLTTFNGQDTSPMWSADGRKVYYVSEDGSPRGCANIVCQDLTPGYLPPLADGSPRRLTTHDDDTVRRARISGNGEWIVYECGADLWVVSTKSTAPPRKIAIEVNADDKSNTERTVTFTRDATEFALSPDEKNAVISVHGELFLIKVPEGGKATRLTESTAYDHGASFSPDGKSILFASDRSGVEDLYLLEPDDPEHPELTKANKFKVKQLTRTPEGESAAGFSPKGDRIAFLRSGKLWTMKPDGSEQKVLVGQQQVFDYDWSPDGKYLAFSRVDGSFASELYIVPADGSEAPKNVTRYATTNEDVTWSTTGNKLAFVSERRGPPQVYVLSLQKPAAPGAPAPPAGAIDWDDVHLRAEQAAAVPARTVAISPEGDKVAFRTGNDLCVASSDGRSLNRLTFNNTPAQAPRQIRWAKKGGSRIYYLNGAGELRYTSPGGAFSFGASGPAQPAQVEFKAKMTIRRDEEFGEMFAQGWRALSDSFYDPAFHGSNWSSVRAKYQPLVAHVAMREDLYALVGMMLGELNASHLGVTGRLSNPDEETADLGLIFDETYKGPGLKVAEVLKRGPADKRGLGIKPGDIITGIDRTVLSEHTNVSQLLNNKVGESILLDVTSDPKDPKARRRVEVVGIKRFDDKNSASKLMYERWVAANAAAVEKQSGGKVGYIHIPSMNDEGMEVFVRTLYSDHFDKDAVVIDVRYNGGGFTHDQVLNYLAGKEHTLFRTRDGGEGLVMRNFDRKWTKPLVVMTNNRSYSDAEIFPHAFRTLGLGKVVGQATGGHVIGTYSIGLIDGSQFRIPKIGVFTVRGVNMEREGVIPDVAVDVTVEDWRKGIDTQLAKAVEVVSADVQVWKKQRIAGGSKPDTAPVAIPTAAPMPKVVPPPARGGAGSPAGVIPPARD
jgi:tricorn protease